MKKYKQLTDRQQIQAVEYQLNLMVRDIITNQDFLDNEELLAKVKKAAKAAADAKASHFVDSYILAELREELTPQALTSAKETVYNDYIDPSVVELHTLDMIELVALVHYTRS
jgi:hypothetical protein